MKKIIWIDDSQNDMEKVSDGAFIELWKEGILNIVCFFGDSNGFVVKDDFNYDLNCLFTEIHERCIKKDNRYSQNEYENVIDLYNLVYDSKNPIELVKQFPNDSNNELDKIMKLINVWKDNPPSLEEWSSDGELDSKYNVSCFLNEITADDISLYALDLVLLAGDENKLNCNKEKAIPIISIELYHYITEILNKKCIVYSQYTFLNRLQDNWNYLYKIRYGNDSEDNIKIMGRDGLYQGSISMETICKIKNTI